MFGATKGPNTSQYDFKGTSVPLFSFSSNHHPRPTNPHPPEPEEPVEEEHQEDHNLTREEDSATNSKIKPTNLKAPNTETLSLQKIPTTPNKILRNLKKKSTLFSKSASD